MNNYKTYTNSELEDEIERLKQEYEIAQKSAIENYKLMMDLAAQYGEANDILEVRQGKKKEK